MADTADPDHPALVNLRATCDEIDRAEQGIKRLKQRLGMEAIALQEVEPGSERLRLCRYAYWNLPRVGASDLAWALLRIRNVAKLRELIGPGDSNLSCDRCTEPMRFESRTAYADALSTMRDRRPRWAERYRVVCRPCEDAIHKQRAVSRERQRRELEKVVAELEKLTYDEYLHTEFWRRIRAQKLDETSLCEICDERYQLDVYKVGSVPARDHWNDLITLCPDCAELLMSGARIIQREAPF